MQRSKHLAMMFLLGAVLVGGALGFTADRYMLRDTECSRDPGAAKAVLYNQLELTAEQRASWDAILDERHRQYDSLLKPIRPQLDSVRASARAQFRALLTPEQLDRFEAILRERKSNDKREASK